MNSAVQQMIDLDAPRDVDEVLRMMGCTNRALRPEIRSLVRRLMDESWDLVRPRGVYVMRDVLHMVETRLDLAGSPPIHGPIAGFLQPARRVAVFVVTIGEEIEQLVMRNMAAGRTLDGYILDAIGSATADAAADALADHLLWTEAAPNEAVTPPFSPGYCGFDLDHQELLFSILDASAIGVSLLPTMIMQPMKSVSGLLGIGDACDVMEHGVPCESCDLPDCRMRRPPHPSRN